MEIKDSDKKCFVKEWPAPPVPVAEVGEEGDNASQWRERKGSGERLF